MSNIAFIFLASYTDGSEDQPRLSTLHAPEYDVDPEEIMLDAMNALSEAFTHGNEVIVYDANGKVKASYIRGEK